ncbi:hypothetical protein [Devosia sp.]|uniref:hypothetical protein n=1 Tax=Devosia sp. TaxID=1871048 RepID=UPI003BAA3429
MRSFEIAIAVFFIGASFLIAAFSIGILNFETCWDGTSGVLETYKLVACNAHHVLAKQVGFGLALNWSVGLCVLFPFFIYCVCETVNGGLYAIDQMVSRQMIVSESWKTPSASFMRSLVRKRTISLIVVVGVATMLATGFVALEYYRVVGRFYGPEPFRPFAFIDPQNEADWSIAAPICAYTQEVSEQCRTVMQYRGLNGWFAGLAYAYLVYLGAISAISFMFAFGLYVRFVFASDIREAKLRVVPDLHSVDSRRGFEVLEDFFFYSIAGCFVLFAMGYLVTLQNVYLRQPDANLATFFAPLIPTKLELDLGKVVEVLQAGAKLIIVNGNSVAVSILGLLFFFIVIASAASALGRAAKRGADRLREQLNGGTLSADFSSYLAGLNLTPAAASTALADIRYWPVKWPTVNVTIASLVLGILALLFVNFGAVLVAAGLAYVVKQSFGRPEK